MCLHNLFPRFVIDLRDFVFSFFVQQKMGSKKSSRDFKKNIYNGRNVLGIY